LNSGRQQFKPARHTTVLRISQLAGNFLIKMALEQYTYVFVIGTLFAMLDAFNNGASK
jgi:hypothetical protein